MDTTLDRRLHAADTPWKTDARCTHWTVHRTLGGAAQEPGCCAAQHGEHWTGRALDKLVGTLNGTQEWILDRTLDGRLEAGRDNAAVVHAGHFDSTSDRTVDDTEDTGRCK